MPRLTKFQKYFLYFSLGNAGAAILVGGVHRLWFSEDISTSMVFMHILIPLIMLYYANAVVAAANALVQLFRRQWVLALYSLLFIPLQFVLFAITILVEPAPLYVTESDWPYLMALSYLPYLPLA